MAGGSPDQGGLVVPESAASEGLWGGGQGGRVGMVAGGAPAVFREGPSCGSGGPTGRGEMRDGRVSWGGVGVPTLPPLTWRVQPAVCAQSQKNGHTCTPARVAMRACRREANLVQVFFVCFELSWVGGEGLGPMDPRSGAPKGGGPKISLFFPSPAAKFVLFFPLWGSSRGILVCV